MGRVRLTRPYYHCRRCGQGRVPWDEQLGLTPRALSPAAQEVVTLAGTLSSFAEAADKTLPKLCGLRLGASTVERTTEDAGRRLGRLWEQKQVLGAAGDWSWQPDAQGRRCAYVSVDATGVRQQGPQAAKAEGRMAYVGLLYSPPMTPEAAATPHQVRYVAGVCELAALGPRLRRQAAQVGWDEAQQQVALTDGGAGLEDFMRVNFPRAECILDFWHAKEHLVELSQAWFPAEAARKSWLDAQCHRLKHEGGPAVLDHLEAMDLRGRSRAAREAHRAQTQYFRNQVHRMDYPRYRAQGWQIGSGPVEAACKTVVGQRLKCSGMRWGEDGADALCHLRALWLSEPSQWEAFWRDHPN